MNTNVVWFDQLGMADVDTVGGKNASLGEMITQLSASGIAVPNGFATTAMAYRRFLAHEGLAERINKALETLDVEDVNALADAGKSIRQWVREQPFTPELEADIRRAFTQLDAGSGICVAVRSSATAEDLPDASFAGQQATYLNVRGVEAVLTRVRDVFASLYNDRAIAYRVHQGFSHAEVALSAGIQRMVRSDLGTSGVMFTLDTESGFEDAIFITAAYGLGETVVQGSVNPDEYYVYKPALAAGNHPIIRRTLGSKDVRMVFANEASGAETTIEDVDNSHRQHFCLSDQDIITLAEKALTIERHYGRPMDIEWGKDGEDGNIYILQARPETVQSKPGRTLERFTLQDQSTALVEGRSIGQRIGTGTARVLADIHEMDLLKTGDVLVTDITDPDWEPVMKRASAIVTNRGGRTCHAAIIARELGIPAVVGTGDATQRINDGQQVTVSCAQGEIGYVYDGELKFHHSQLKLASMPPCPVKITLNVGNPDRAFEFAAIPNKGVGLARLEFIIARMIGIHPRAVLELERLPIEEQHDILNRTAGYASPKDFYVSKLVEGVATIAAAFAPEPVIVRLSDFKSNEYRALIGGERYEPEEENPMLGFRGAARYLDPVFEDSFALECQAMRFVREDMGLRNVWLMVPFVRTVAEARQVLQMLAQHGLKRGQDELQIMMMCELPTNALLADEFLQHFDGFSIGSNDLTQLTLGLDRDSGLVAEQFDERDPAVKALLSQAIAACRRAGKYVGICGQGPSDNPDLARWLVAQGIESMSLNPDSVIDTWLDLAAQERAV